MLLPETPFESLLYWDPHKITVSIGCLQFVQHVFDFDEYHLALSGDLPGFLCCLWRLVHNGTLNSLPNIFERQSKKRDSLSDAMDFQSGLSELTSGSIEEQREPKPRASDLNNGSL